MTSRKDLQDWLVEALSANGGKASVSDVCEHIWVHHESDLRSSGRLLFTWQYDVRWGATQLRHRGKLKPANKASRFWELA